MVRFKYIWEETNRQELSLVWLGIPVKAFPEDKIPSVQYAALIADLVMKTKSTLKQLNQGDSDFVYLRMRTKQDTEMIVTDYIVPGTGNEYILVCIQQCKFAKDEELTAEIVWWGRCIILQRKER